MGYSQVAPDGVSRAFHWRLHSLAWDQHCPSPLQPWRTTQTCSIATSFPVPTPLRFNSPCSIYLPATAERHQTHLCLPYGWHTTWSHGTAIQKPAQIQCGVVFFWKPPISHKKEEVGGRRPRWWGLMAQLRVWLPKESLNFLLSKIF